MAASSMDPSTSKTDGLELVEVDRWRTVQTRRSLTGNCAPCTNTTGLARRADHHLAFGSCAWSRLDADSVRMMLASAKDRGIKFDPDGDPRHGREGVLRRPVGQGKMLFRTATTKGRG